MKKMSGWSFWAVLLAVMGTVGFAQVSSKNANESGDTIGPGDERSERYVARRTDDDCEAARR
jgi:hypothetical protein